MYVNSFFFIIYYYYKNKKRYDISQTLKTYTRTALYVNRLRINEKYTYINKKKIYVRIYSTDASKGHSH